MTLCGEFHPRRRLTFPVVRNAPAPILVRRISMYQIAMETDADKLAYGLAFTFLLPVIAYLTGMAWNKFVGAPSKVNKAWATFCLGIPIVALVMFVTIDLDLIYRLWSTSPYVLSICAVLFGLLAPASLVFVMVRLWRTRPSHHD